MNSACFHQAAGCHGSNGDVPPACRDRGQNARYRAGSAQGPRVWQVLHLHWLWRNLECLSDFTSTNRGWALYAGVAHARRALPSFVSLGSPLPLRLHGLRSGTLAQTCKRIDSQIVKCSHAYVLEHKHAHYEIFPARRFIHTWKWQKFPVENAADKAPMVMLKQLDQHKGPACGRFFIFTVSGEIHSFCRT